jgi:hypothetical protein
MTSKETMSLNQHLVLNIINMSKQENPNWDTIDEKISQLKDFDSNAIADQLFELADTSNANVMDAVASSFNAINLSDDLRIDKAINLLSPICLSLDEDFIYASGRSALFLDKFKNRSQEVSSVLDQFKANVDKLGTKTDLIENIPNIELLLIN